MNSGSNDLFSKIRYLAVGIRVDSGAVERLMARVRRQGIGVKVATFDLFVLFAALAEWTRQVDQR